MALVALGVAGCSSGGAGGSGGGGGEGKKPAQVSVTPVNGTQKVSPASVVTVKVANGKLSKVTVAGSGGRERQATGTLAKDGLSWRTTWPLRPDTTYTVNAQATGEDGKPVTSRTTFTTLTPKRKLESGLEPGKPFFPAICPQPVLA